MPRVVIVGCGFAGLNAARELAGAAVDVTLVDRNNFHTFQPLLYQVATAGLNPADVAHAARGIFHDAPNVVFRRAEVRGVDWDARALLLDSSSPLVFDYLVLAAGATTTFFGIPGADQCALPLYTLRDAVRLRNHVLAQFERADLVPEIIEDGALTFVIVGAGPTGVEVAGALVELFEMVLAKDFREVDVRRARVVLVEMADHVLGTFSPKSRDHARRTLESRGVEVRLGSVVKAVEPNRLVLDTGEHIPTQTVIWAAGVRANPLADLLGLAQERGGRITVEPGLSLPGRTFAFVVGDLAAARSPKGELYPQLAPVAIQSGRHAARQIRRLVEGRPTTPFRYKDKGIMATIGRRSAVAELPLGVKLSGTPAWMAWLGLHLVYLIGFRNRLSVLVNWAWNYLTYDRGPRVLFDEPPDSPGARG